MLRPVRLGTHRKRERKMHKTYNSVIVMGMVLGMTLGTAEAATTVVPEEEPTIQQGIDAAGSGDTVYILSGTYYERPAIIKSVTLMGESKQTTIIDGEGTGGVVTVRANNVNIHSLTMTNGRIGLSIEHSDNCMIADNVMHHNSNWGINAGSVSGTVFADNEMYSNGHGGIYTSSTRNSIISGNSVHDHAGSEGGIRTSWGSNNVTVERNNVYANEIGINIANDARYGTIKDNLVWGNAIGIRGGRGPSLGYTIYHNDLVYNDAQAIALNPRHMWDNGYPSGGNYWSDYLGEDRFNGPAQNLPGSDGIGDVAYTFSGDADAYPLMQPNNAVSADIKPATCPSPLSTRSRGVLPVAIPGTATLDVTKIDPASVTLNGVSPLRWAVEDITVPHEPYLGREDCRDCTTQGPDGYPDLTLKFSTQAVVEALGDEASNDCVRLIITGWVEETSGRVPVIGEDLVETRPRDRRSGPR